MDNSYQKGLINVTIPGSHFRQMSLALAPVSLLDYWCHLVNLQWGFSLH